MSHEPLTDELMHGFCYSPKKAGKRAANVGYRTTSVWCRGGDRNVEGCWGFRRWKTEKLVRFAKFPFHVVWFILKFHPGIWGFFTGTFIVFRNRLWLLNFSEFQIPKFANFHFNCSNFWQLKMSDFKISTNQNANVRHTVLPILSGFSFSDTETIVFGKICSWLHFYHLKHFRTN